MLLNPVLLLALFCWHHLQSLSLSACLSLCVPSSLAVSSLLPAIGISGERFLSSSSKLFLQFVYLLFLESQPKPSGSVLFPTRGAGRRPGWHVWSHLFLWQGGICNALHRLSVCPVMGGDGSETNRKFEAGILKTLVHFYTRDGNESAKSLGKEE